MKILLKNGTVIDYKNKLNDKYDILIEDEKIVKVDKKINETVDKEIDCTNLNIIHTTIATINKNIDTKLLPINDIIGITSTGNITFFTK